MTTDHDETPESAVPKASKNMPYRYPISLNKGIWVLIFGVIFPMIAYITEILTGLCAEIWFDPLPTALHYILVPFVPVVNLLIWLQLRKVINLPSRPLLSCGAIAIGIATYYSILFLPLIPLSFIMVVYYGIGALPYAPVVSLWIASLLYRDLNYVSDYPTARWSLLKGILAGLCLIFITDAPNALTLWGTQQAVSEDPKISDRGIRFLRMFSSTEKLRNMSYRNRREATGLFSLLVRHTGEQFISAADMRKIYYRVTGEPFNRLPDTYVRQGRSASRWPFDADQGITSVGGRVEGVELISSRLDGVIAADEASSYMEWVLEFQNNSYRLAETRLEMALPADGVVSRATLWVNGEEREAAFAGKSQVIEAYQSVVSTNRDPLLVTHSGPNQIMAQAFPILPNGGTIKFRIGITSPLTLDSFEDARLLLPAIVEQNFEISNTLEHNIWIESQHPIQSDSSVYKAQKINDKTYRLTGNIKASDYDAERQLITIERDPDNNQHVSRLLERGTNAKEGDAKKGDAKGADKKGADQKHSDEKHSEEIAPLVKESREKDHPIKDIIIQQIVTATATPPDALIIIIDGSASMAPFIDDILQAFEHIPDGNQTGLMIAEHTPQQIDITGWSENQHNNFIQLLKDYDFVGGKNNLTALNKALLDLESRQNPQILWIHGPQPIEFLASDAALTQTINRLSKTSMIAHLQVSSGSNRLANKALLNILDTIPADSSIGSDLAAYIKHLYGQTSQPQIVRRIADTAQNTEYASAHIARNWAFQQVMQLQKEGNLNEAAALAIDYQLVTPLTGAVVLENQQQYEDNDLTPVDENTVPTIPEPHEWMLFFIALACLLWFVKQNRHLLFKAH